MQPSLPPIIPDTATAKRRERPGRKRPPRVRTRVRTALLGGAAGGLLLLGLVQRPSTAAEVGGLLLGFAVLASAHWMAVLASSLVRDRRVVRLCWMDVEDRLQHRHAVIGSLVQAVRAATAHERAAVERTLAAQAHAVQTAGSPVAVRGEAERALNDAVSHLLSITAGYPSVVASREVAELREQLTSADNRLALARHTYNHAARNTPTITDAIPATAVWRLRLPPPPDPFEPDSLPG